MTDLFSALYKMDMQNDNHNYHEELLLMEAHMNAQETHDAADWERIQEGNRLLAEDYEERRLADGYPTYAEELEWEKMDRENSEFFETQRGSIPT